MKKEYISPEAIAIKIQTMGMLAVSGFNEEIDNDNPINPGDMLAPEFDDSFDFNFDDDFNFSE